jgi:hypothetical protein
MKTISAASSLALFSLVIISCKPHSQPNLVTTDEDVRRQLEETQAAYQQKAATMEARSEALQQQLDDLQRSIQEKENAELQARLEAMQSENEQLKADAEDARLKSDELREQLAEHPAYPRPDPGPYDSTAERGNQAWMEPEADYTLFYEELSPYGQWLDVEGYGYAWRPALASRSTWRPYLDGRWVWSDHGWAWDTPEPFGWACYHYGRWVRIARHGWVWVPGREWAPAWVSWRSGGDSIGWAPLPPERRRSYTSIGYDCDLFYDLSPSSYIFIEAENFGRSSYVNSCLPFTNVTQIFAQTVNVTNIIQINQQQTNFFVNRGGPRRDWVEQRVGRPIPVAPVRISRTLERPQNPRSDRDSVRSLQPASLPPLRKDRQRTPPKITEKITRPALVDTWEDIPKDRRQKLRETITRQAKEPKPTQFQPTVTGKPPERDRPSESKGGSNSPARGERPEVQPGQPVDSRPAMPKDRIVDRDRAPASPPNRRPGNLPPSEQPARGEGERPSVPPGKNRPATPIHATDGDVTRANKEGTPHQAEMPPSESATAADAEKQSEMNRARAEMVRRQAEAEVLEKQRREDALRAKQAEELKARTTATEAARQSEMHRGREAAATRQQEMARKQAEVQAAQNQMMEQQKRADEFRRQQAEEIRAKAAQQAEMANLQREEQARQAREVAAQQAEMANLQREEQARQAREVAARQQAEMANRQREEQARQAREAAARQQAEMANRQREEQARQAREAAARQQAEMANRQREEQARQAREAAARQQAEMANRQQQEAARRAAEEERRRSQPPERRQVEERGGRQR